MTIPKCLPQFGNVRSSLLTAPSYFPKIVLEKTTDTDITLSDILFKYFDNLVKKSGTNIIEAVQDLQKTIADADITSPVFDTVIEDNENVAALLDKMIRQFTIAYNEAAIHSESRSEIQYQMPNNMQVNKVISDITGRVIEKYVTKPIEPSSDKPLTPIKEVPITDPTTDLQDKEASEFFNRGQAVRKTLSELYSESFNGTLSRYTKEFETFVHSTVKDTWMPTRVDNRMEDSTITDVFTENGELSLKKLRQGVREKASAAVLNYYESSSFAMGTISNGTVKNPFNISNQPNNVLVFNSERKLPGDKKLIFESEDGIKYYTHRAITDSSGDQLLLVVDPTENPAIHSTVINDLSSFEALTTINEKSPNFLNTPAIELKNKLQINKGVDFNIDGAFISNLNQDYDSINIDTAKLHEGDATVLNAYFAQVLINNLDTLVGEMVTPLSEAFIEEKKTGYDEMSGSLGKRASILNIISTPRITSMKLDLDIIQRDVSKGSKPILDTLKQYDLLDSVNLKGDKAIEFLYNGKIHKAILVKVGAQSAYIVNTNPDEKTALDKGWRLARVNDLNELELIHENDITDSEFDFEIDVIGPIVAQLNRHVYASNINLEQKTIDTIPTDLIKKNITNIQINNKFVEQHPREDTHIFEVKPGTSKYLSIPEVELATHILNHLPADFYKAGELLKELMYGVGKLNLPKEMTAFDIKEIATSLYHRFFNPEPYIIKTINTVTGKPEIQTHKSLLAQSLDGDMDYETGITSLVALTN